MLQKFVCKYNNGLVTRFRQSEVTEIVFFFYLEKNDLNDLNKRQAFVFLGNIKPLLWGN